jgi:hypothetical protein
MEAQSQIFFAGRYTYRKPSALIVGFLFLAFGGVGLRHLFLAIPHTTWSLKTYAAGSAACSPLAVCSFLQGGSREQLSRSRFPLPASDTARSFTPGRRISRKI